MTQPIKHLGHCVPATVYLPHNKSEDVFIQCEALFGFICDSLLLYKLPKKQKLSVA